ncbi:MAG TPA: hypothetical protein PLO37_04860 [Candidatus Hydrogenedentes bacterium]|nr:hypothetical protein [Candidatus Hydrogenedentota bacterium]HPG66155.1 hypothetical protein [Candidatus Hydrogenedentota bacterium]
MSGLELEYEWMPGEGITAPELRQTMARLVIRINGAAVTEVSDGVTRALRDGVYVPLYSIAEWAMTNWFALMYESKGANREFSAQRHLLSCGAEGFALPRLSIVPEGDWVHFSWQGQAVPYTDLRFLASGEARLRRESVSDSLLAFIRATVLRLRDAPNGQRTLLEEEWESFSALDAEERAFCEAAGALGLDPFSTGPEQDTGIVSAAETLPDSLREEFFASALWHQIDENVAWVKEALDLVPSSGNGVALHPFRERIQPYLADVVPTAPWEVGYRCAREVRSELGNTVGRLRDEEFNTLGWESTPRINTQSKVFEAIASMDPDTRVGRFVTSGRHIHSQRFVFARTLFEYVTARAETFPRLVTRAETYTQKGSRAFAAELLAPAETLREHIAGDTVTLEEIEDLAEDLGVSSMVIAYQLKNHSIVDINQDWLTRPAASCVSP